MWNKYVVEHFYVSFSKFPNSFTKCFVQGSFNLNNGIGRCGICFGFSSPLEFLHWQIDISAFSWKRAILSSDLCIIFVHGCVEISALTRNALPWGVIFIRIILVPVMSWKVVSACCHIRELLCAVKAFWRAIHTAMSAREMVPASRDILCRIRLL